MHRARAALVALVTGAGFLSGSPAPVAGPNIAYDWQFSTDANPALPDSVVGGTGVALATIVQGLFSSGWISTNAIFGAAQGVWDLGSSGSITLSNAAGLAGGPAQERLVTVSVTQYQDGTIYGQPATVSVPGAVLLGSTTSFAAPAVIGEWDLMQTLWRAGVGTPVNSILLTGVAGGSLVGRMTVESSFTVLPSPQLAIRLVGPDNSQVEISWLASYTNAVLESNSQLDNPLVWAQTPDQGQVSGNLKRVTVNAAGTAQFYRLRLPL